MHKAQNMYKTYLNLSNFAINTKDDKLYTLDDFE